MLDVRDPEEFAAGHLAGSVSAPGGQLVQATDQWIAVRGARIALIDDDGVRARMAGAWLGRWAIATCSWWKTACRPPPCPPRAGMADPGEVETIDADTLAAAGDALVVDLARSIAFREGHIPGALWGVRSRLEALRGALARRQAGGADLAGRHAGAAGGGRGARR